MIHVCRTIAVSLLFGLTTSAIAATENLPLASTLPADVVKISPVVPAMGEHWANPKDLPLGPIYGVSEGRVIFLEFMIDRDTLAKGTSFTDLKSKAGIPLPSVEHVDFDWEPDGHEGYTVPHYDIHLYFVPHNEHMAIKP
ncbi:hypothetical protein Tola_1716 [Tolumonas auensis DSM 9187]|uniref:TTHB210-like domain-containing protein n=1 Tax=Tolumonas auensis (strain DSM 9187 / NBRC 110442 / TA 4) TaxID=595494 RepID=C4LFF9_TOLAT|nr:DUF5602 domain-containing protein [Tolumonas auensis]ACQ93326.1 hypothetical protein Tola_1716 [Tolumonas auensis DSM 9187]